MEKISIFIVLLSLFVPEATCRSCSYNKYYKKGTGCVECPACDAGSEATTNCGYNEAGERTPGAQCKKCSEGLTFKDQESTATCGNCQVCRDGKIKKKECTLTSNTVCECPQGTYDYYGNCRPVPRSVPTKASVTTPLITPKITTTAHPVTTPNITTTAQISTQMDGLRNDEPMLQAQRQPDRPFPQPGWIVLFCLLGFLFTVAFIIVSFHKRTRKQISGFCCRKYRALWPDSESQATSNFMTAEGHYDEERVSSKENYATPILPWDEPVPTVVQSTSTSEQVYCSCATKDMGEEKMQCACTQTVSDPAFYKMAHTSSSSETISDELQYYYQDKRQRGRSPTRKSSPSHSTSSGVSSLRSPDLCPLISPYLTPTPSRGLSPDHHCVAPSSSSSSPAMTPRGGSPEHHCVTASSASTCETSAPLRGLSPGHCFVTSSSSSSPGVTPRQRSPELCRKSSSSSTCLTPLRGRSPDPPRIQIQPSDEQDSSNQSKECSEIPVSIEACDKKHDVPIAPTNINSSPPGRQKRSKSQPSGKRKKSLSPTKDLLCACQQELYLKARCKEAAVKEKDVHPVSTNKDTEFPVGTDIEVDGKEDLTMKANVAENDQRRCMYRPIKRDGDVEHRCPACSPLPSDQFFKLINRERLCLKKEICKELDRSYKELAILGRVDSEMKEYEASSNPAERVLERLNALHPGMKLEEFRQILLQIKRLDVVEIIYNHHLSCTLCLRNKFDSKV